MKRNSDIKNMYEKKGESNSQENCVFARSISRKLNKHEEKQVSGGKSYQIVCYDTYIGTGLYLPDCTVE